MARNAAYTDKLKAQVVARYNDGAKVVDIAREFDIPVSTVYEFRQQAGLRANRQRAFVPRSACAVD